MKWSDIAGVLGKTAPLIGGLLINPVGTVASAVGTMVASALGVEATADAVSLALKTDPGAAVKLRQIESDEKVSLRRMTLQATTAQLAQINQTYRTELASSDTYISRMRPTFGYIVAFSLAFEIILAGLVFFFRPDQAANVVDFIQAIAIPQGIAMTVLGVYINGRTKEKMLDGGVTTKGVLATIFNR